MRIFVALLLVLILFSLLSGLVYLIRDRGQGERAVKALTWRIGLSIVLFLALMAGHYLGLLQPAGL
ncbi:MAG: twin transmembrane helix small protein [Gallionellaceae bacterium]|nr:twin transmembrane helix small protein [Gallionellaceae bacterium]